MNSYVKPWKLCTLALGIALLIVGSRIERLADWDAGLSIVMALCAYLFAPITIRSLLEGRFITAIVLTVLSIDTSYVVYNWVMGVDVSMIRSANAMASLPLYLICGIVWSLNDSDFLPRRLRK